MQISVRLCVCVHARMSGTLITKVDDDHCVLGTMRFDDHLMFIDITSLGRIHLV